MVSRRGAETWRLRVEIEKASFAPRLCVKKIVEAFLVQSLSVPLGKLLEPRAALLEELGELLYGL